MSMPGPAAGHATVFQLASAAGTATAMRPACMRSLASLSGLTGINLEVRLDQLWLNFGYNTATMIHFSRMFGRSTCARKHSCLLAPGGNTTLTMVWSALDSASH